MQFDIIKTIHDYVKNQKGWKHFSLKNEYKKLQLGYRNQELKGYDNFEQIQAYVFTRFPATYAVVYKLIKEHFAGKHIKSVIDWGCGVGTASIAISEIFNHSIDLFLIEKNKYALDLAVEFLGLTNKSNNIKTLMSDEKVDLVVMSYSLNELKENKESVVKKLWELSDNILIIEPGTNAIFNDLLKIRDLLIDMGGYVVAPCFHSKKCPLEKNSDWCHFQERIERTKEGRFLKQAERSFENEAYSYILLSKSKVIYENKARIIEQPKLHKGHLEIKYCRYDGLIDQKIISKKFDEYKDYKKKNCGECILVK